MPWHLIPLNSLFLLLRGIECRLSWRPGRSLGWYVASSVAVVPLNIFTASTWLESHGAGAFTTVTCSWFQKLPVLSEYSPISSVADGGVIVTSIGGPAVTLATSGAGVVTSIGGSEYTVIPSPTR